jgi:hypothetical protein
MPLITVGTVPIQFPDTGNSPVWSDAIIQFAQAVAAQLANVIGPYDITPQVYNLVSDTNTNVSIPNLQFPVSNVAGAVITYTITRVTNTSTAEEAGVITIDYHPERLTGAKWDIQREFTGNADVTFAITDAGQVTFSSTPLGGIFTSGQMSFRAIALIIE